MNNDKVYVFYDGNHVLLNDLLRDYARLRETEEKSSSAFEKHELEAVRSDNKLKPYQAELLCLQSHLEQTQKRMIVLFEGRDAAGKGGAIRRITRYMNERHFRTVALPKPTEEQKTQWYYQKYVANFPRGGEIVLFDRSWYNRAMVERVFGFCTEQEYEDFMNGVVWFEKDLVRQDTIFIKFYFSVDKETQAERFERRRSDPLRKWKLSEIDVQAQERWDDFTNMKYEMLKRTHTVEAPWVIIRSHDKFKARLNGLKVMLNSVPYSRGNTDLNYEPDPDIVVSGARELEMMDAELHQNGFLTS